MINSSKSNEESALLRTDLLLAVSSNSVIFSIKSLLSLLETKMYFKFLYPFNTSFTKTNSSWLITESIKALGSKTSIVFNLAAVNNTILLRFFHFYLIIEL